MGFVIVIALALYLLISMGVIAWAIRHAKKSGKSTLRWGWGAALAMYLLVFWDWIPTVVAHKYYCDTQAGFWVYKTPEQWKQENPGVMETLISNKGQVSKSVGDNNNFIDTNYMNQRFIYVNKHHGPLWFNRWRHEQEIIDGKTNDTIAREVNFSTSQERRQAGWSGWKFWLDSGFAGNRNCNTYVHRDSGGLSPIALQLQGK